MQFDYPKFVIFELKDTGPLVSTFDSAHEVAMHLWGRYLPYIAIFKDRKLVHLKSADVTEVERELGDV